MADQDANLITRDRATMAIMGQSSFSALELRALDQCVSAASACVRHYCKRDFAPFRYDEVYDGTGRPELTLRQYPVLSVERVATTPLAVLSVTNTATTNQRAAVQVTSTGLTLTRVASGATVVDSSVTWASNATLSALAAAVTALGNGWSGAVVSSDYNSYPSSDIRPLQGALGCARSQRAWLTLHVEDLSGYEVQAERGILLYGSQGGATEIARFFDGGGGDDRPCWGRGSQNYRVIYAAGYDQMPPDVEEAAAQLTASMYWQSKRDPAVSQQQANQVFATFHPSAYGQLPGHVTHLLRPYRRAIISGVG